MRADCMPGMNENCIFRRNATLAGLFAARLSDKSPAKWANLYMIIIITFVYGCLHLFHCFFLLMYTLQREHCCNNYNFSSSKIDRHYNENYNK